MAQSSTSRLIWLLIGLAWISAVVWLGWQSWPRLSLDLPQSDPAVRAAYDDAVRAHVLWYGFLALVPPFLMPLLVRIFRR